MRLLRRVSSLYVIKSSESIIITRTGEVDYPSILQQAIFLYSNFPFQDLPQAQG
jgi:hypothetical protein